MTAGTLHSLRTALTGPMARSSAASLAIRLSGLALGFLQAVLCARLLGAEGYGTLALALAVAQCGATFALFGLQHLTVRRIAAFLAVGAVRHARLLAANSLAIAAIAGIGLSLLTATLANAFPSLVRPYDAALLAAALLILPVALVQLFRGIAQGSGAIVAAQLPGDVVRPGLFCAALLAVAATGSALTPSAGLLMLAGAFALAALLGGVWSRRALPAGETSSDGPASDLRLVREAAPFLGLSLVAIVMTEAGTLLLGLLADPAQVGIYQPAARLLVLMTVPVQAAAMAFAPRVSELQARGERTAIVALTRRFTLATTAGTAFVSLGIALAAPLLLGLFGGEFAAAAPLVWLFALTQIANAACGPVGYLMTMTGRAGSALLAQGSGLAATLIAGALLVPAYGALGAAIASAAGIVVWNGVLLGFVWRRLGFDPSLASAFSRAAGAA